jgi:hypothetical protein
MASPTATSVAASVEGTSRKRAVSSTAVDAPNRSRSCSVPSIGRRVVFFVSLLASTVAAFQAKAEPVAHATQGRLDVMVTVVSRCAIDSSAEFSVHCATPTAAIVHTGSVQTVRSAVAQSGLYTLTTVNF